MKPIAKILVVTRDIGLEHSVVELLLRAGCATDQARTIEGALECLQVGRPSDYVLVDGRLPAGDLLALLGGLAERGARAVLLCDGVTPREACRHPSVARELELPWTMDRLMRLIDWMDGDDPYALDAAWLPRTVHVV